MVIIIAVSTGDDIRISGKFFLRIDRGRDASAPRTGIYSRKARGEIQVGLKMLLFKLIII
jgi:hypothetical protein